LLWAEWFITIGAWIGSMVWLSKKGNKYFNFD
jgi:hypothetical protein